MFTLMCEYPKPQFVMHFEPKNYQDFEDVAMWLIGQTGLDGWKFRARELKFDGPSVNKLMSALTIDDPAIAFQAKLTFPDILLNYNDMEHRLAQLFFFPPQKYRRIDSPNYDIVPVKP